MTGGKVLFIDDEEHLRISSKQSLELGGYDVDCQESASRGLDLVGRTYEGVVVSDIRMPGLDGMQFLQKALEIDPDLPVVLITGHGDVPLAVEAMRIGAYDFIEKPFAAKHLLSVVGRALEKRRLTLENRALRSVLEEGDDLDVRLTGRTQAIDSLRRQIRAVAKTDADVLIVGETGTGKEVAARALHDLSDRSRKPFVAINCAALPADLIESELFGHEQGAFAGAMRARFGKFEHAQGGTIFLDEIESMPLSLQVKLLRVIQDREIVRLGSNEPVALDVRFIATSKLDLEQEAAEGRFRADLLYRINVVTLTVPALRDRSEDVPRIFLGLLAEAAARYNRDLPDVPASVMADLTKSDWPGNVRELRNAADRFLLGLSATGVEMDAEPQSQALADRVAEFEKNAISATLIANGGRLKPTYETLGLSRKSLYEKMQKYDLQRDTFAESEDG